MVENYFSKFFVEFLKILHQQIQLSKFILHKFPCLMLSLFVQQAIEKKKKIREKSEIEKFHEILQQQRKRVYKELFSVILSVNFS
jgi:hypothetical protein